MRRYGSVLLAITIAVGACTAEAGAQAPPPRAIAITPLVAARQLEMDRGAAAVWQSLEKLQTRASILMVEAHPDDEDGGLLTYESRGAGARVALLTLNRGEGGQNLMSNDFNDALGLVRTQELLAADRYYGAQQFFTRVVDFGFSKTEADTMQHWGHQRALADVVRVVRMVRPLVIVSTFVGGPSDGHGNHAAAGAMAQEAYTAAADPNQFPDQIREGLRPWQALKVYARVPLYAFTPRGIFDYANGVYTPNRIYDYVHHRWIGGKPSVNVRVPEGDYSPVLAASYSQVGREGLAEQHSQLAGIAVPDLRPASSPYHLYGSQVKTTPQEASFFSGVDTSLTGIADLARGQNTTALRAGLAAIQRDVEAATAQFRSASPQAIAPGLAKGLAATDALLHQVEAGDLSATAKYNVERELRIKRAQFNDATVEALGLQLSARVAGSGRGGRGGPAVSRIVAIPGESLAVDTYFANPTGAALQLQSVRLRTAVNQPAWQISTPPPAASEVFQVHVPAGAPATRPYYSRPNDIQPWYNIDDARFLMLPTGPYPLSAWVQMRYQGVPLTMAQVVETVAHPAASGVVENPLVVAPPISVVVAPRQGIVPLSAHAVPLTVTVHSNVPGPAHGSVHLRLPQGWSARPASAAFSMKQSGEDESLAFTISPRDVTTQSYAVTAVAAYDGRSYEEGYHTAGYAGLRPYNLYFPAVYRTRGVRVAIAPGLRVGYISGTGDGVAQDLVNLGVHVHFLSAGDIATGNLAAYNVIVMGIRTYSARPELATDNSRLLQYVRQGGVLIVQYQSAAFDHDYGPYPYVLHGNGQTVAVPSDPVTILRPQDPVLHWPNHITGADFRGWVKERGHGFLQSWDPRYTALLETHDAQQPPQKGGLIYADYGKGVYVYEGVALYRQLADGVPGAYRLFANLLSLPQRHSH
ncbi:MAG: PIG-L family deacetylase [Terriglobales bacterium]